MSETYFPYRPNLQGPFLARFQEKAIELDGTIDQRSIIEALAQKEFEWATTSYQVNPGQRKIYRACWLLLRDLLRAGWRCRWYDGALEVAAPEAKVEAHGLQEIAAVKERVRRAMADGRRRRILEARDFINRMEKPSPHARARVPVQQLVADGHQLANDLADVLRLETPKQRLEELRTKIRPYLQLVRENEVCPHTGHRLGDIWRYFRFTWATPAENTPGRTLLYLVRDAARPFHPVMGLASLENAPIKIRCRDEYLGWTIDAFTSQLKKLVGDVTAVRGQFEGLVRYVDSAVSDVSPDGLCDQRELEDPSDEVLQRLAMIAARSVDERREALRAWESLDDEDDDEEQNVPKGSLGNVSLEAEDALYRRKRAEQLARLLSARRSLEGLLREDFSARWSQYLASEVGKVAIRTALMAQKSRHVGTSLLELNVCGAVPPYNLILGGKLVALAVLSPEIVRDYRERYGKRPSDIASRLKGEDVIRPAELVFIGTTSLYQVGASQYNRLRLPAGWMHSNAPELRWSQIGTTTGYGTLHISRLTLQCLEDAANPDGVKQVYHVFGEGPSPKLRIIRQAADRVFERGQRNITDEFPKHSMGRLVYGAWLASNGQSYLLGESKAPNYHFDPGQPAERQTERIVDYWQERWLLPRLSKPGLLDNLKAFTASNLEIGKELSSAEEDTFSEVKEAPTSMVEVIANPHEPLRDFVRALYRGTSAYADRMNMAFLDAIHVPTDLDEEIVRAVEAGRSVVLTGNPGDGKTHLLRILEPRLTALTTAPVIELDASRVLDTDLKAKWESARSGGRPFCVAINEAVLHSLAQKFPDFAPLREAWRQVETAVSYESQNEPEGEVAVFDLSRRNVLSPKVVGAVLQKLASESFIPRCAACPGTGCDMVTNRALLRDPLVQDRLQSVLDRVACRGTHATVRELQALVSFLLFAGRSCTEMVRTGGEYEFALPQLPYTGEGSLFDRIRESFDPAKVSHPVWDEALVTGDTQPADWVADWHREIGNLDGANEPRFVARKRAFYFFHAQGDALLQMADQDEREFADFLMMTEREALRLILRRINRFFGHDTGSDELRVWQSHRYDQSPRRTLYSVAAKSRQSFQIVHPKLRPGMARAFDLAQDHVIIRLRNTQQAKLRVDFPVFELLARAERGVPVMFLEVDATRRLWQFMEGLAEYVDSDQEPSVLILDAVTGEQITVTVDLETEAYLKIRRSARGQ